MYDTTFDTATTSLCDKLITHAENEINKYISKRYDVAAFNATSTAIPPLLTTLCETLTEGYMYQRMSRGGKESMGRGKVLIEMAISNLDKIAKYELDLLDSNEAVIQDLSQTAYRVLSNTEGYSSTFNEDDELSWRISENKLNDIDTEREE
jgi:hypothetical protein